MGWVLFISYPILNIDRVNSLNPNPFLDLKESDHMRLGLRQVLNGM